MTIKELEKRCAELEAERDRWREMAERFSKQLVPCPLLQPVVAPPPVPNRVPIVPLVTPQPDAPSPWPADVVITCGAYREDAGRS